MNQDANYRAAGLKLSKEEPLTTANRDPGGNGERRSGTPVNTPKAAMPVRGAAPEPSPTPAPIPQAVPPKKRSKAPLIAAVCACAAVLAAVLLWPRGDAVDVPSDSATPTRNHSDQVATTAPAAEIPQSDLTPEDIAYLDIYGRCADMAEAGDYINPMLIIQDCAREYPHDPRFEELLSEYKQLFIAQQLSGLPPLDSPQNYCRAIRALETSREILECPEFTDTLAQLRLEFGQFMNSRIAAGKYNTFLLHSDGTVDAYGHSVYGELAAGNWSGITAISAGDRHVVGLRSDGTVISVGGNDVGQTNVGSWYDIIAISAGDTHTVGLKADGTLVATGFNEEYQCDMQTLMRNAGGKRIVGIAAGYGHTLALLSDGTVAATGVNQYGECNVSGWTDIVAIVAGSEISAGLRSDGTVVATGLNTSKWDLSGWQDIVYLAAGDYYLVGLRADGTVVAAGTNDSNYSERGQMDVYGWGGISMIAAGNDHTVALGSDGTVHCVGSDEMDQCRCNNYPLH